MTLRARAGFALPLLLAAVAACTSEPSQPPIDTSGGANPSPGVGATPASNDAGEDAAATDAATDATTDAAIDAQNDAANNCLLGTCAGCCTPLPDSQCVLGVTSAQCGANGAACQVCTAQETCTVTNGCQPQ